MSAGLRDILQVIWIFLPGEVTPPYLNIEVVHMRGSVDASLVMTGEDSSTPSLNGEVNKSLTMKGVV